MFQITEDYGDKWRMEEKRISDCVAYQVKISQVLLDDSIQVKMSGWRAVARAERDSTRTGE